MLRHWDMAEALMGHHIGVVPRTESGDTQACYRDRCGWLLRIRLESLSHHRSHRWLPGTLAGGRIHPIRLRFPSKMLD